MERITKDNLLRSIRCAQGLTGRDYEINSNEIGTQICLKSQHNSGTTLDITTYGTKREVWEQFQAYIKGLRSETLTRSI